MKERLMVHGKKHWIADKEGKVLVSYHETGKDAKMALKEIVKHEKAEGYYVRGFYETVEGVLGALRLKGYTALDDVTLCSDIVASR